MKITIELYSYMTEKHYSFEHKYKDDEEAEPIREWLAEEIYPEIEQATIKEYPQYSPDSDEITIEASESGVDVEIYAEHDYDELYRTDEYDPYAFDRNIWQRGVAFETVYSHYFNHLETGDKCRSMKGWRAQNEW